MAAIPIKWTPNQTADYSFVLLSLTITNSYYVLLEGIVSGRALPLSHRSNQEKVPFYISDELGLLLAAPAL